MICLDRYVKQSISLVPNNASAWNYLRGLLEHNSIPYSRVITFIQPYTLSMDEQTADLVDLDNPPPSKGAHLPCALAIEFLADIYEAEGGDSMLNATEASQSMFLNNLDLNTLVSCGSLLEMNTTLLGKSATFITSVSYIGQCSSNFFQVLGISHQGRSTSYSDMNVEMVHCLI